MIPKSLSASSITVADACLARYKAENIEYARGFETTFANLGTSVHGGLEAYVKRTQIEKTDAPSLDLLLECYKQSYIETFNTRDINTVDYVEGYQMMNDWFTRTSFEGVRVISCEVKDHFDVQTSIGPIPFNYIWDRFDQIGDNTFKVVDYKSNRFGIQPKDLKGKIQARAYGLAAAILLKKMGYDNPKIWVEFDLLRHQPVGTVFTREDNEATWKFIHEKAEDIIATSDINTPERINPECTFCVRKTSCKALQKNILVGGIHSLTTIEDAANIRAQVEWQKKGLDSLLKDLDTKILAEAKERDLEQYETDLVELTIAVGRTRAVDAEMVQMAIGPKLFEKYGSASITLASVDKLLKGKELDDTQKSQLRSLIYQKVGEPKVKVKPKNTIDD